MRLSLQVHIYVMEDLEMCEYFIILFRFREKSVPSRWLAMAFISTWYWRSSRERFLALQSLVCSGMIRTAPLFTFLLSFEHGGTENISAGGIFQLHTNCSLTISGNECLVSFPLREELLTAVKGNCPVHVVR